MSTPTVIRSPTGFVDKQATKKKSMGATVCLCLLHTVRRQLEVVKAPATISASSATPLVVPTECLEEMLLSSEALFVLTIDRLQVWPIIGYESQRFASY